MACCLIAPSHNLNPMLTYHHRGPMTFIWWLFHNRYRLYIQPSTTDNHWNWLFRKFTKKSQGSVGLMVVHVQWFDTDNLFLPVCLSVHIFGSMYRSAVFHIMTLVLYFRLFQQIPCQCSISSHAAMANIWAWRKKICLRHETLPRLDVQQIRSRIFYRHPQLWIPVLWFTYDVNSSFRRPC